jgi:DNA polymerase-3 subunit delta'
VSDSRPARPVPTPITIPPFHVHYTNWARGIWKAVSEAASNQRLMLAMHLNELMGHDEIADRFRCALAEGRLAHTFLFVGPDGIGKRSFAVALAQALLCQQCAAELLDPCGRCPSCVQALAGTNPDLIVVGRPAGKSEIPVGVLKGDDAYPVEQSLLFNLGLRPFYGGRKVAILDDADFLNVAGANCLLKTLEEPPPASVLILISTSADKQLPTIRSRAQIIRFRPLANDDVAKLLVERQIVSDSGEAKKLAVYSGGSLTRASEFADSALWDFRREMLKQLGQLILSSMMLAQSTIKFVDDAGKDAPPRRARLRLAIGFSVDFFRELVRRLSGLQPGGDAELIAAVESAAGHGAWNLESAADAVERCLQAAAEVDRNANQHTLIEAWLEEVARGPSPVGSRY